MSCLCACQEQGSQTLIARGNVLASRGQRLEAVAAYREAAKASPTSVRPLELLGHVLFDLDKLDEAKDAYEQALAIDPQALDAHLGLARLKGRQGDTDGAIEALSFVLQRQKGNLFALLSRAQLKLKRGTPADVEGALQDTAQAMAVDAKNVPVLYTRGLAFLAAGKPDEAGAAFELLAKAKPTSPLAPYGQARVAMAKGDRATALEALKQAKQRATPDSGFSVHELAKDPAFAGLTEDPAFAGVAGGP